jgi:23S rRNA-/tRNA-specific pseudouridylate synthase
MLSEQPQQVAAAAEEQVVVLKRPKRAVKGVASRTGPLNEEVSRLANVSLEDANELIKIGAVWARMETLTEQDLLSQYDDSFGGTVTSMSILYSDFASPSNSDDKEVENNLDDYVERMEAQRYRRILTPSVVEGGTDIRVYPQPRRFPSCYQLTEERLLYEDTTFIVVDKPPMLPTQVRTL